MGIKKQLKKIGIYLSVFFIMSLIIYLPMESKINALEEEKSQLIDKVNEQPYPGDASDKELEQIKDDIVIKIISKLDPSIDINYVNKDDLVDENNKSYSKIELSVSGDLDKVKEIESVLNNMGLSYKIENMDIKNKSNDDGEDIVNYVECIMTFKIM